VRRAAFAAALSVLSQLGCADIYAQQCDDLGKILERPSRYVPGHGCFVLCADNQWERDDRGCHGARRK
jgi:hypothetical protein